MKLLSILFLMSLVSSSGFAGVKFDEISYLPDPITAGLKDKVSFCDVNSKFWNILKDHQFHIAGKYWLTGNEFALLEMVYRDQNGIELPLYRQGTKFQILQLGASGFDIRGFNADFKLVDVCNANPNKSLPIDDLIAYLKALTLSYKVIAQGPQN